VASLLAGPLWRNGIIAPAVSTKQGLITVLRFKSRLSKDFAKFDVVRGYGTQDLIVTKLTVNKERRIEVLIYKAN